MGFLKNFWDALKYASLHEKLELAYVHKNAKQIVFAINEDILVLCDRGFSKGSLMICAPQREVDELHKYLSLIGEVKTNREGLRLLSGVAIEADNRLARFTVATNQVPVKPPADMGGFE